MSEKHYDRGYEAGQADAREQMDFERAEEAEELDHYHQLDVHFDKGMSGAEIMARVDVGRYVGTEVEALLELVRWYGIRRPRWDR